MDSASPLALPRRPGLLLGALVAVTLALRLAPLAGAAPVADTAVRDRIQGFLDRQSMARAEPPSLVGATVLSGTRGTCAVTIAELHPLGWQNDMLPYLAGEGDAAFFVLDGTPYADPPLWRARAAFYGRRIARALGVAGPAPLLLGVVTGPGCTAGTLPWESLRG